MSEKYSIANPSATQEPKLLGSPCGMELIGTVRGVRVRHDMGRPYNARPYRSMGVAKLIGTGG